MPASMNNYDLPTSLTIGGVGYPIRSGWRHIVKILIACADLDVSPRARNLIILRIVYPDWKRIPDECLLEALQKANDFIDCGQTPDCNERPKLIDWEQDAHIIIPEINKVAKQEIRLNPELHWWTVYGYFMSIERGYLANILSIRRKLASGEPLEKHERKYYLDNRNVIDLTRPYTAGQAEAIEDVRRWMEG